MEKLENRLTEIDDRLNSLENYQLIKTLLDEKLQIQRELEQSWEWVMDTDYYTDEINDAINDFNNQHQFDKTICDIIAYRIYDAIQEDEVGEYDLGEYTFTKNEYVKINKQIWKIQFTCETIYEDYKFRPTDMKVVVLEKYDNFELNPDNNYKFRLK